VVIPLSRPRDIDYTRGMASNTKADSVRLDLRRLRADLPGIAGVTSLQQTVVSDDVGSARPVEYRT
jgi:hypothetical protein